MVTFIPEWIKLSARDLQIKKVLNALEADCVVRKPIRPSQWAPDFFIQCPAKGWLAVTAHNAAFSELDPTGLFESSGQAAFEDLLSKFGALDDILSAQNWPGKLILLWGCTPEQTQILSQIYGDRYTARFLSKKEFIELGARILPSLPAQLTKEDEHSLLGRFFPETEIPPRYAARRSFHRDNSATLTRFFLDSQQEWASKLDLELPEEQMEAMRNFSVRLINGVAGSGKTLIALNRALMLAKIFPSEQILLLSHNTPIVADMRERLHASRGGVLPNLEIATFFSWAYGQWVRLFPARPEIMNNWEACKLIEGCRAQWPQLKLATGQIAEEVDFINDLLIGSKAQYLEANRAGRGFALKQGERELLWMLYDSVTSGLRNGGRHLWSSIASGICLRGDHSRLRKYRHILIDEAQFFAPSWFQAVRLSMAHCGSLFLCADPNQGFLKRKLSWRAVAIDVTGRTKKLRRSYRTTQAILRAASRVLAQLADDPENFLEPDFAGMEPGSPPILIYTDSPQDSVHRVINELAAPACQPGMLLGDFLVIYGDKINKSFLYERLGKRFGVDRVWWLNKNEHKKEPPLGYGKDYLRMASIETATGLEGKFVFLLGVESLFTASLLLSQDRDEQTAKTEEQARKLYMAMTRAAQQLVLVSTQRLPANLEVLFGDGNKYSLAASAGSGN